MKKTICIIDYGCGNTKSILNSLKYINSKAVISNKDDVIKKSSHLILPGVGSYAATMERLHDADLVQPILEFIQQGRPTLGICLGMQLFSSTGFEGADTEGLSLIEGEVIPLKKVQGLNLPHVGWNEVIYTKDHPVLEGVKNGLDFYFVNGFFFKAKNKNDVIASTNYGQCFPSIVGKKNVLGVQFHPEKSQINGLRILDNFCLWDGLC